MSWKYSFKVVLVNFFLYHAKVVKDDAFLFELQKEPLQDSIPCLILQLTFKIRKEGKEGRGDANRVGVNQGKREEGRKEGESKRSRKRKEFVLCSRKVNLEIKLSSFFLPSLRT